jgi:protein-S-isoprenylcysteine O-methyltransferase Ste14
MKALEHRIPPPLVGLLAALLMWALAAVPPLLALPGPLRLALCAALVATGVAFDLAGLVAFHRARTTVNPLRPDRATSLVTGGVYRVTRNPMYVGMALLLAAWAVWLASPWALLVVAGFVLYITRFQIEPEERVLRQRFPEFEAYAARVRRWL